MLLTFSAKVRKNMKFRLSIKIFPFFRYEDLNKANGAFERKSPQGFANDCPGFPYCILGQAKLGSARLG